ncbi:MAG: Membrane protein [Myxococcaceae bacterium]|nr:Membrane protein [Myxococcaceae bacterium]
MTTEQPPRDALRPLRPLASVGIPLLREERSAVRNRRLVLVAIAGAVLAMAGGGVALWLRQGSPRAVASEPGAASTALAEVTPSEAAEPTLPLQAPTPDPAPLPVAVEPLATPEPEGPAPRVVGRYERRFGKALSIGDALRKSGGLNGDEADEVVRAMTGVMDFRHSHPEDTFVVERGKSGQLERLEYRAAPTVRYEATRDAETGALRGRQIQLEIETIHVERAGVVDGALDDALEGLKLRRSLSGVFADVFSGKVNFSTQTRRGDTFRVVLDEEHVDGEFLRYGTVYALEYQGERTGTVRAFWHESKATQGDFFDEQGRALHGGWLRTPLRYDHVSSGYGVRFHPVLKRKLAHDGIDYAAQSGTKVSAAAAGIVRTAGMHGPNGNLIAIVHPHGFETFYAHLSRFAPGIKPGVRVKQRQLIAYVGSTGRSTGPHLHFALKRGGRFLDPNSQLNGPGLPLAARELPEYKLRVRELMERLANIPLEKPMPVAPTPPTQPLDFEEDEL